jgi:uncharacterized protein with FMN-binding domain
MNNNAKIISGVLVVGVLALFMFWSKKQGVDVNDYGNDEGTGLSTDLSGNDTNRQNETVSSIPTAPSTVYKNGSYSVVKDYVSPAGKDSIGVKIEIANDVVTKVEVTNLANHDVSKNFQNKFIPSIGTVTVGKSVADLKIGVVSGASLASAAFNEALEQVRTQAKF